MHLARAGLLRFARPMANGASSCGRRTMSLGGKAEGGGGGGGGGGDRFEWGGQTGKPRSRQFLSANKPTPQFMDYMLLTVPITTFALGVWQWRRRQWKRDLIEKTESRTSAPAVDLPFDINDIYDLEYQKVIVRGQFDHSREMYIGPRSRIPTPEETEGGGLFTSGGNVGWLVVTPFELSDRHQRILVNRGWVPQKLLNPMTRKEGQIEGQVELVGVVRTNEVRQQFTQKNRTQSNKWQTRDLDALSFKLDTEPIFLDAVASSSVPGGPIGGQTRISFRNDHLSYLITWFSLSAATSYMWAKKFIKRF